MADEPKSRRKSDTPPKTREEKIAALKARLTKELSRQKTDERKERNGQLMAMGIIIEELYKHGDNHAKQIKRLIEENRQGFDSRNVERSLAMFSRIDKVNLEKAKREEEIRKSEQAKQSGTTENI